MEKLTLKAKGRLAMLILIPVLTIIFLYVVRAVLLPFFLAVAVAYFLNPPVAFLEKKGIPRTAAILLVYVLLAGLLTGILLYGVPAVTGELTHFGEAVPRYGAEVQGFLQQAQEKYNRFALPESLRLVIDERIRHLEKLLLQFVRDTLEGLTAFFSFLLSFAVAPFLAFYILKDLDKIRKTWESLLPCRWRKDCLAVLRDIDEIITGFLRGNLTVAFLVGLLSGIGYAVVGMEYALILGVIAGITDLIPFFGPFLGAIPAVVLALLESKALALKVIVVVLIVQQMESQVITPKIMGDSLGLNPLVIVFALLAGGELFGLPGILLAVPGAAIIRVVVRYIFYKLIE